MGDKIKKLYTLEQLAQFCEQKKFYTFNSKDTGYTLSVQVPGYFEAEIDSTKGLLFTKLRVCHTELNKNKSYISEENMKKAMPSLKYRPVLAKIHQLDDGTWDFHSHDMNFIENEDGEIEVEYEEQQIGTFTADDPYLEYNEEYDKTYVIANAVIPEEYTKAADIVRAKNGTKVSCELCIESMSYNATEKRLELEDFWFSGCTCLGAEKDGTQIGEGMEGSRLDIADFSTENNGIFKEDYQAKMIEALDKLNIALSNFNIKGLSQEKSKEGGNAVTKFEELLNQYGKTVEDITFDYENLSEEELEAKFAEMFEEENTDGEGDDPEPASEGDEGNDDSGEGESDDNDDDDDKEPEENPEGDPEGEQFAEKMVRTFELSHDDIRYALYNLLIPYEESDNEYYWIMEVFDSYFVYQGYSGKVYGQKYTKDGDNVAFDGERYELFLEYLTESEKTALAEMRSNYATIESQLKEYQAKEEIAQKDALFTSEDYSSISDKEEFKALEENHAEFSVDELKSKLDAIILDYAKKGSLNFSAETEKKSVGKVQLPIQTKAKKSRYGSLFSK